MREKLKKKLQLINFSYLTILKFSFGIVFSISFLGAGKSTLFIKKTSPNIATRPISRFYNYCNDIGSA
jgi:hypothetical protein